MKPYYETELGKLYHGDCLEIMPQLEPIDLVVTSPNYNNWRNRRTQAKRKKYWQRTNIVYGICQDKQTDEDYKQAQILTINMMVSILKDTGTICYNHKDRIFNFEVLSPLEWILKTNSKYRQRITWNRRGMQAYNPVRFYRVDEDIYILGKKARGFKWNKDCAKYLSVWDIPPDKNIYGHPATFPIKIAQRLIKSFTHKNDIVIDPFLGSGTTATACEYLNRRWIGIEIEEKYCEIAAKRIENERKQLKLF
jgi:DNA modification methylase